MRDTEGAVAIMTVFILVALLGMASLAIDMGQIYFVRNDLQNTADGAALAAAGKLITTQNGVAVRDANAAQQAALTVAQRQRQLAGLPDVDPSTRNDLTITFGEWNLKTSDPKTAWTEIGSTCGSTSNANAIRITLRRGVGTVTGPVINLLAGIFGVNTSDVAATATAYLGYTNEVQTGGIQVPLALPSAGPNSPLASNGPAGWFARLFGPSEAVATATKTITFKDTGGANVTVTSQNKLATTDAAADANQPYFYTNRSTDSIPDAITYPMQKIYTPSLQGSTNVPVVMRDMKVGDQIWPGSEYRYGSYMTTMFGNLKSAYNAKKNSSGVWHTTLVVHGLKQTASLPGKPGFLSLARLLAPFWPSEAFACVPIQPPTLSVRAFASVDITAVASAPGNDGSSYSYPKTMKDQYTGNKSVS
jgi:Flp pilus assembly protein TadG